MSVRSEIANTTQAEQSESTCRCVNCRRPLTHPKSVAALRGPVCRLRAEVSA
ncbi:DUF6011 domain-containing protein [Mycolicibacter sinensis]|uniref:DUF6011 domain-containing protein n=1 Tax=Mycolicibacter sinensis (strain JDM601) TaxID=875328 RepID=UPI003D16236B